MAERVFDCEDFLEGSRTGGIQEALEEACPLGRLPGATNGVLGATILLPGGQHEIEDTIVVSDGERRYRYGLRFQGQGGGIMVDRANGGRMVAGTALNWAGPEGDAMFRCHGSRAVSFADFAIDGKDRAGIAFDIMGDNGGGGPSWPASFHTFERVTADRCVVAWDVSGYRGTNAQNDFFTLRDCLSSWCGTPLRHQSTQALLSIVEGCNFANYREAGAVVESGGIKFDRCFFGSGACNPGSWAIDLGSTVHVTEVLGCDFELMKGHGIIRRHTGDAPLRIQGSMMNAMHIYGGYGVVYVLDLSEAPLKFDGCRLHFNRVDGVEPAGRVMKPNGPPVRFIDSTLRRNVVTPDSAQFDGCVREAA